MAPSQMPLHCNICPKKPNFSDVSHLLTHVASKGHLSHYYKIKVRSAHDEDSRTMIETYDNWYVMWDIERLMSDRMHLKDKRKSTRARGKAAPAQTKKAQPSPAAVDPELSYRVSDMATPVQRDQTPLLAYSFTLPYSESMGFALRQPHSPKPRMYLWSTQEPSSYKALPLPSSSPTPLQRGIYSSASRLSLRDSFQDTATTVDDQDEELGREASRLKGIQWPGMNIFDAATPEMKRKRNQKKDTSVIEHLEQNSLVVEATEMIFTPSGALRKERKITGNIDFDTSPLKGYEPTPPKRRPSTRPPLAERDVNRAVGRAPQADMRRPPVLLPPTQQSSFEVFDERAIHTPSAFVTSPYTENLPTYSGLPPLPYYGLDYPTLFTQQTQGNNQGQVLRGKSPVKEKHKN